MIKKKKRCLSLLLSLALVLGLLPVTSVPVYADSIPAPGVSPVNSGTVEVEETTMFKLTTNPPEETKYPLWVGGVQVTEDNAMDTEAHPTWYYDESSKTLTLDNFTYTGEGYRYAAIYFDDKYEGDPVINLVGNNEITHIPSSYFSWGIRNCADDSKNLVITGDGTLNVTAADDVIKTSYGISTEAGAITISSCEIIASGMSGAIFGTVKNNIAGIGWNDTAGTEGEADIAISADGQALNYKKVQFPTQLKEAATITKTPSANELTYNGTEQELVSAGSAENGEIMYALGNDDVTAPATDKFSTSVPKAKKAGTYYVWYYVKADANHKNISPVCQPVTIEEVVVELEWGKTTFIYDGEEHIPTLAITNLVEGDEITPTVVGAGRNVGFYVATVTKLEGEMVDCYALPEEHTREFNIVKADDNPKVTVSMNGWTYGEAANEPRIEGLTAGKTPIIEYKAYSAPNSAYTEKKPVEAGTYNIRVTVEADYNNEWVSVVDRFTIERKEAGLEWGDTEFVYNGKNQIPTATVTKLVGEDKVEAKVTGAAMAVGTHIATVTHLTGKDASNYKLPADTKTDFVIKKSDLITGQGENPAMLTIASWVYGDPAPEPVIENNIGGGTVNFAYALLPDGVEPAGYGDLDYSASKPFRAGMYVVKAEIGESENYNATVLYSRFGISPKVAEFSWSEGSFIYDGEEHIPTCEVSNLEYGDECEVTVSGASIAVGEHTAEVTAISNENYVLPETRTKIYNISKDEPELSVSLAGWTYGDVANDPSVEGNTGNGKVTYTYFIDKELNMRTGNASGAATEGGVPVNAGTYYVKAAAAETDSYEEGVASAEFTIEPRVLSIEWTGISVIYDGKEHIPVATATNLVGNDAVTLSVSKAEIEAGDYEVIIDDVSGASIANYVLPKVITQSFKIAKKAAEFTWGKTEFVYTGKDQIPTVKVNNLETGDECEVTLTGAATAVGTHTATAIKLSNDNYRLPDEFTKEFTIVKADLNDDVKVLIGDWIYDEHPSVPSVTGNIEGANVTFKYKKAGAPDSEYTTTVPTQVGNYTVIAIIDDTAGYNGKPVTADFTINKAESYIDIVPETIFGIIYDSKPHELAKAGKAFGGTVLYALATDEATEPEDGDYTEQIPTGIMTGTYYVWYRVIGDSNHNDSQDRDKVETDIIPVTRESLIEMVGKVSAYHDEIKVIEGCADIAKDLKKAIDAAQLVVDDDNVTDEQIGDALKALVDAYQAAFIEVEKILEPRRKMAESNRKRDRLVEMINSRGFDTINGIYQTPYDTISMNYTVTKGKITQASFDVKSLKDGDNYLTVNTGIRMLLTERFTIYDNFASKTEYRKVTKALKLKDYGFVLDIKKLKGRSTYEMILVSADGKKRLILDVVDLALNKKSIKSMTLTTPVKETQVSANAVSENKIGETGCIEKNGVVTITTTPALKSEINARKSRSARFISGVWMVGDIAIPYGKTQTISKGKAKVYAKVNSDGSLSLGKAEDSGKGSLKITYILNGKSYIKHGRTKMKSKTYKAKIKVN